MGGVFDQLHGLFHLPGLHQLDGLVHRFRGKPAHFQTAALQSVCGMLLPLMAGYGMPGQFDFKRVEALQLQASAEPGDGGLRGAALVGQLGDGHELHLGMLRQHKVRDFALGGRQLIIGGMNAFENIHILFVHFKSPFVIGFCCVRVRKAYSPRISPII